MQQNVLNVDVEPSRPDSPQSANVEITVDSCFSHDAAVPFTTETCSHELSENDQNEQGLFAF